MGKSVRSPPPSPLIGRGEKVQVCPGLKRTFEAGKNTGNRGEKVQACSGLKRTSEEEETPPWAWGEKVQKGPGQKVHLKQKRKGEKKQIWPGLKRTFVSSQWHKVMRTNVLQETFWCFRAAIKRGANCNRFRFLSDSHWVPLCCSPSFIAHPRKPL